LDALQAELEDLRKGDAKHTEPTGEQGGNGNGNGNGNEAQAAHPELALRIEQAKSRWQALQREHATIMMAVPAAMVMKERAEIRPAHIFIRGDYDKLGERVERDTPGFLPPMQPAPGGGHRTRMDLAKWLVQANHPLTARVAVNRI